MNAPAHRSYSQMTTFYRCAHQYYLAKVLGVSEHPAMYLAAGSAVHDVLEQINHALYEKQGANAG